MKSKLPKELQLLEGETILHEIEGNARTESPNPIVRLLNAIGGFILAIFGYRKRTFLVITNQRVIRVNLEKILFFITKNTSFTTLAKHSIYEIGYAVVRRWLFFKTLYLRLQTVTENSMIVYKGNLKELTDIVSNFSAIISL